MGSVSNRVGFSGEGLGSSGGWASSGRNGTGAQGILATSRPGWSRDSPHSRFASAWVDVKMRWSRALVQAT